MFQESISLYQIVVDWWCSEWYSYIENTDVCPLFDQGSKSALHMSAILVYLMGFDNDSNTQVIRSL